jgi:uncharacterized protein (DUF1330 family)
MTAYAIAHLRTVNMGPGIAEYLTRIDATLEPFGGRFIVHGARAQMLEGELSGDLVVIEFPDMEAARAWYGSPAYREILPLRTDNSEGIVLLIDGVPEGHKSTDLLTA